MASDGAAGAPIPGSPKRSGAEAVACVLYTVGAGAIVAALVWVPSWMANLCHQVGGEQQCSLPLIAWLSGGLFGLVALIAVALAIDVAFGKRLSIHASAGWVVPAMSVALSAVYIWSVSADPYLWKRFIMFPPDVLLVMAADIALVGGAALSWWATRTQSRA